MSATRIHPGDSAEAGSAVAVPVRWKFPFACLAATAVHGTVCFAGMLSDSWTIPDFYPMDWIPNGVRLTTYSGQAQDLPAEVLQRSLDRIESGDLDLLPVHSYPLADIAQAHEDMASGRHVGKLVGLPWD